MDSAFLALAVQGSRDVVVSALSSRGWSRSAYIEVDGAGVGVSRIGVIAWPEPPGRPVRVGVDVVRIGDDILETPVTVGFDVGGRGGGAVGAGGGGWGDEVTVTGEDLEETRPQVIRTASCVWLLVPSGEVGREVVRLQDDGQPVWGDVDTSVYCYRMVCPRCGRARYARRNSIHQVRYCRVCTEADRRRRRSVSEYRTRQRGRVVGMPAEECQRLLALWSSGQYLQKQLAGIFGITPSAVSRIIRRYSS